MKEKTVNNPRSLKWEQNGELAHKDLSELMNSEDPKEDAMIILKKLSHEN